MKYIWIFLLFIVSIFSMVAGVVTLLSSWFGWFGAQYEPYVDGPDPISMFTLSMVLWLYLRIELDKL